MHYIMLAKNQSAIFEPGAFTARRKARPEGIVIDFVGELPPLACPEGIGYHEP
jgi:hypothetical protein